MFELNGKVALVTGARRGWARAHAEALAKQVRKSRYGRINLAECEEVVAGIKKNGGKPRRGNWMSRTRKK